MLGLRPGFLDGFSGSQHSTSRCHAFTIPVSVLKDSEKCRNKKL